MEIISFTKKDIVLIEIVSTDNYHFVLSQQLLQPSPFPLPLNSIYRHEYFYQRLLTFLWKKNII